MPLPLPPLLVGDALLYSGRSWLSWVIRLHTFSPVSHVAIWAGDGTVIESREGKGVQRALFSTHRTQLYAVCRPSDPIDVAAGMAYFATVEGAPYDKWAFVRDFFRPRATSPTPSKLVCSEFAAYWYMAAGMQPVNKTFNPGQVSPRDFLASPHFEVIWCRAAECQA